MSKRRINPLAALVAEQKRREVQKSIQACMGVVKVDFGQRCDAVLIEIVERRFDEVNSGYIVVEDDPNRAGVKLVDYDGERVAVLHAPEFSVRPASLGLACMASMVIDEIQAGKPMERHKVESKRTVVGV